MYIKVKTMDGKESVMLTVSKMSLIEEIRRLVKDKLNVEPACQRLFFRGKQVWNIFSYKQDHVVHV
jgi:hypothetical protein